MKPQLIAAGAVAIVAASALGVDVAAEHGVPAGRDAYKLTTSELGDGGGDSPSGPDGFLSEQVTKVVNDLFGTSTTPGVFDDLLGIDGGTAADVTPAEDAFNLDLTLLEGYSSFLLLMPLPPLPLLPGLPSLPLPPANLADLGIVTLNFYDVFNQFVGLAEEGLDDLVPNAYDADFSGTIHGAVLHGLEVGRFDATSPSESPTAFIDSANLNGDLHDLATAIGNVFDPGSLS